jgi:hypothetical protein
MPCVEITTMSMCSRSTTSIDNAAGRQENRRVKLVVSGDAIGSPANTTTVSLR